MKHKLAHLNPGCIYHIYNRAIGSEKLFLNNENYSFFLKRYRHFISPVAETFCYCLMPNHFHFLVRIKSDNELVEYFGDKALGFEDDKAFPKFETLKDKDLTGFGNLSGLVSKQFSNLFNSYTKAFNKINNRKGGLFMRPFNRLKVTEDQYLVKLVHYIHYNPVEAGLYDKPENGNSPPTLPSSGTPKQIY